MIVSDLILPIAYTEEDLKKAVIKKLRGKCPPIRSMELVKRSVDARKKPDLYYVLSVRINEKTEAPAFPKTVSPQKKDCPRVLVCGAGPAGLFAALKLLQNGIPVLLLERGKCVEERLKDVESFFSGGALDPESNVQFGEGGAGTFSDGKLNTLTHVPENLEVLSTFVACGADPAVLYDQKPHLGTDVLFRIVQNLRMEILKRGGEIRYSAKLTDIETDDGRLKAVYVNHIERIPAAFLLLAIGHSARDTYRMLFDAGLLMEQKAFALGVRIEHPAEMITLSQYGTLDYEELGNAPYKLTYQAKNGRGVYSFCMCPGGFVVNASSEPGKTVVNGMSNARRDARNSNSALVVQIRPEDFESPHPLSGIRYQEEIEKRAFTEGQGCIPVMRYQAFRESRENDTPSDAGSVPPFTGDFLPEMKGAYRPSDLRRILPSYVTEALLEAIPEFGRRVRGFDRGDAVLSAVESRTSSPVRILRDERREASIKGIFPVGEGAGYAGGILSSARDGLVTAEVLSEMIGENNG